MRNGRVEFVELDSQQGAECRLRNPFERPASVYRDGKKSESLEGSLLRLATRKGEKLVLVAAGAKPEDYRRLAPEP